MTTEHAWAVLADLIPCPHENYSSRGTGGAWCFCEDCGADVLTVDLDVARQRHKDAKDALQALDCPLDVETLMRR